MSEAQRGLWRHADGKSHQNDQTSAARVHDEGGEAPGEGVVHQQAGREAEGLASDAGEVAPPYKDLGISNPAVWIWQSA